MEELIYKDDPDQWWSFVLAYYENCRGLIKKKEVETCREACMVDVGIDKKVIEDKFDTSFTYSDNWVLKEMMEQQKD